MRISLDANILFSAAKSAGAVRGLLGLLEGAGHTLFADDYVVAEARRNLEVKGQDAPGSLDAILASIEVARFRRDDADRQVAALLPEKDRPVLAAAIRLGCHALVTADKTHFGRLYGRNVRGVAIHSPRSIYEALTR
jgi:predicted nucleic acid-binding protein